MAEILLKHSSTSLTLHSPVQFPLQLVRHLLVTALMVIIRIQADLVLVQLHLLPSKLVAQQVQQVLPASVKWASLLTRQLLPLKHVLLKLSTPWNLLKTLRLFTALMLKLNLLTFSPLKSSLKSTVKLSKQLMLRLKLAVFVPLHLLVQLVLLVNLE